MTEDQPTINDIRDFFDINGDEVVTTRDLGYGCSIDITVEELFQMFLGRMRHLNERYDEGNS